MAKYIIINRSHTKRDGKVHQRTNYYTGTLGVGSFVFQNWGGKRKEAKVFDSKRDANWYFKMLRCYERNESGWQRIGYDTYVKEGYSIVKVE